MRLSALLQGSALLEALPYDAVAPLLCDQERRTTLTALALLALAPVQLAQVKESHEKHLVEWCLTC